MNWFLNDSNFTFLDIARICKFFLNKKNFWTNGSQVKKFEKLMAEYTQNKYAVFTSSGSTANTVLAMYLKDFYMTEQKKTVIFPSTTWTTSISPFIREGFTPHFIDINLKDFSIDLDALEKYLEDNLDNVCCIFFTSLIGFVPDIERIKSIEQKFKVKVMFDNCENTFGNFKGKNISSFFSSSTSTYFGHQLQSVEGGFVFTNDKHLYEYSLMCRNHGLTRSLADPSAIRNDLVNEKYDFFMLGNNFRNSDINAFIGSLDFKRVPLYMQRRKDLYNLYLQNLDYEHNLPKINNDFDHCPFCLPISLKSHDQVKEFENYCLEKGIEFRPLISGNLLRQTCYSKFGDYLNYKNSELIHNNFCYVGLHAKVKESQILELCKTINTIIKK